MGEENFPDLVPWLFDSLKTDNSNVERSGAAQGLSEVLSALGTGYFEHVLLDIIRNCSHQKASMRDGYLTLFKYLPRSLGLADENESVRDAALGVGHVLVEHYATTSLPLLFLLLKMVAGTSGKSDEGSSTEAHGRAIIEAALHVWKTIVANTPKTLKEIMPALNCLFIPSAGMQAIDEIVPTLLHALEDDETSDTALDVSGLQLYCLIFFPSCAFNIHALGALAEVAGPGLNFHLGTILPAYFLQWDVQTLAKEAAETVALVIDEEGVEYLIAELLKGAGDTLVKSAILSTLSILIGKGGMSLRPFLPQLQTTFIKCLQDSTRTVRTSAAFALGKLSALSTRVDPLVVTSCPACKFGSHYAFFPPSLIFVMIMTSLLLCCSASDASFQMTLQYMEEHQLDDLLELLLKFGIFLLAWCPGTAQYSPSHPCLGTIHPLSLQSQMFPSIIHCLKDALKDEKIQSDPSEATAYVDIISTIMSVLHDDSSEVRRRGQGPPSIMVHVSIIGPWHLLNVLKDSSTPVQTMFKLLKNLLQAWMLGRLQSSLNIGCGVAAMRAKTVKKNQQVANS
ncbi:hypothetical protein POTOM_060946 [Populus tomentosa]|uniref:Stalled ribosome sensor GCN1-like HEAT repeats region domain-containing protein n=1 Tax=Populus tomentosa TaxID=118781 RepID=A0A8X7XTY0_POPTO|nr:hypothetical protein POTOM_060946 [Populus tomentosa]